MAKSLAAEVKMQVQAILKDRYPASYRQFKLKCKSWSTGGSVDIFWTDGPSENAIKNLFARLNVEHIISIGTERRYSVTFITRVAEEYCQCKGCEMPTIITLSDGSAWMDNDYSKKIPYREIFNAMQKLSEDDLHTLAYRLHMVNEKLTPVRTYIVRRRDYSHGKYPHLAIAREKSYTTYVRKLFRVRRRISENWVEVVEGDSMRHIHNVYELDKHVALVQQFEGAF
jgi:hypothetical protein